MIRNLRQTILELLANIEVNIDYPEYEDIEEVTHPLLKSKLQEINTKLLKFLKNLLMETGQRRFKYSFSWEAQCW